MRDSLKQMRSLLAEIHPPDLHGQGLQSALDDLIAPAAAAGIHASTSVDGVTDASELCLHQSDRLGEQSLTGESVGILDDARWNRFVRRRGLRLSHLILRQR